MDTLDNANNPFAIPNKTNADSITSHNEDGLLLNLTDGLKKNDDMPNNDLIKMLEKSNCERLSPEFDKDDNLGPETDVDNPEDGSISPNFDVMQRQSEVIDNNQNFNPFKDIGKTLEINLNLKEGTFEGLTTPTEESCPMPTNSVHNVSQIIETGAESDSEEDEEWNYVRGEEANKENLNPLQLNSEVAEEEEEIEDTMSQLNPNAAEFVPVSPTRSIASPLGRVLNEDMVLSQSPKKPPPSGELDLNVPSPVDFEKDISQKPHETEEAISNGHQDDLDDDKSVPKSVPNNKMDEFLFGPNAAPFTPIKLLDQSEASSTRAVYGDESEISHITSLNDSAFSQDQVEFVQKDDPMSMSFHQDRTDDGNPFDLNKVQQLPDDVDEFIAKGDNSNSVFNETISDLDEHFPLGQPKDSKVPVTDLDHKYDENKENEPFEVDRIESPTEECRTNTPSEQNKINSPLEDRITSPVEEQKSVSPLKEKESCFLEEEKESCFLEEEKESCFLEEEKEISSPIGQKELESAIEERLNTPIVDQIIKEDFVLEFEDIKSSPAVEEPCLEPLQVSTSCDNLESPQHSEPVTSEPSPNNDEFVRFESEKSDKEEAKENIENILDLDPLVSVKYSEEQFLMPDTTVNEIVNISESSNVANGADLLCAVDAQRQTELQQEIAQEQIQVEQVTKSLQKEMEDIVSSSMPEPIQMSLSFDDATRNAYLNSQSTPESDHPLSNNADVSCLLNTSLKSVADTESVATTEVNSFLQRSLLVEMESPLSPNLSNVRSEADEKVVPPSDNIGDLLQVECNSDYSTLVSPIRTVQPFLDLTSTPEVGRSSSLSPLASQLNAEIPASSAEDKTPKAPPKEGDKKTLKPRATPSTTAKKTPTPRSSLGAAKPAAAAAPSPRPASKLSTKPSPVPPKVNSTTKTESKTNTKPLTSAPTKSGTTTARVPLASRSKPTTVTKTSESKTLTNGDLKPSPRPSTGAVKKVTEVSSSRNVTSTGASRPTSTTGRVPLTSARSATSAAAPKPRPNTLKPAPPKSVSATTTKSTLAGKVTTTVPKAPVASKTSSTLANKDVKAPLTKTFPKPKPAIEKQIKETANKLTASRTTTKTTSTTQVLSKTSVARKIEEKVTGTKNTTNRTTTTAASRPPLKGTKTAATKVGKPKENGVAAVVTEQIIVSDVNGINSSEQFVKDNSPVDNKLIVDNLTETAAN